MLETLVMHKPSDIQALEENLLQVNKDYQIATLLDSLIASVESGIMANKTVKDTILTDVPSIVFNIIDGLQVSDALVNALVQAIVNSSRGVVEILVTINKTKCSSFYIYEVMSDKIIIKVKT